MQRPGLLGQVAIEALEPWLVDVAPWGTPIASSQTFVTVISSLVVYNGQTTQSGAAVFNDSIAWDTVLGGGSWTVELMHSLGSNRPIYTVQVGGATWGTIDGYSAAAGYNTRSSIAGSAVGAGKQRLTLAAASKNASSSGYTVALQHLQLRRTA